MRRLLFLVAMFLAGVVPVVAQQINYSQQLRLARSSYEQGRLHELGQFLKPQYFKGGFTKEEALQGYQYLTLAAIYLEEPAKADSLMLNILRTDHYYEPNPKVDPAEYIALYNTFRTKALWNAGIKFGVNGSFYNAIKNYYTLDGLQSKGVFKTKIGFQAGGVFQITPFVYSLNPTLRRFSFAPELMYQSRGATETATGPTVFLQNTFKLNWLDLNPVVTYRLSGDKSVNALSTYVSFGPGVSYLLSAANTFVTTKNNGIGVVSGPDVIMTKSYKKLSYSLIASAGLKYKFGSIFLTAEIRAQYFLNNAVNPATRTNQDAAFNYGFTLDDYKINNLTGNIGFSIPYFNPKKKIKK